MKEKSCDMGGVRNRKDEKYKMRANGEVAGKERRREEQSS